MIQALDSCVMSFNETVLIPGSSFYVDLAALDARHPIHYSRRLLIFRCISSTQRDEQLAALKTGLQALISRCPILGGKIVALPPEDAVNGKEDWRTIVPDKGIELVVKDLRSAIVSFEELEAADFPAMQLPYDLLVPVPEDITNERPFAACKVQFSAINGGTIITWAMSHSVADGSGTNELMRILSEETRLAQEPNEARTTPVTTNLGLDRNFLRDITSDIPFNIEQHPAYRLEATSPPNTSQSGLSLTHPFEATSAEIPVFLRISPKGLAQLKADATTPGELPISTHDALSALIWRSVLMVRRRRSAAGQSLPTSTVGSLFLPSDARHHLNLRQSYIGNAVYQLTAALDLGTLLSPSGLQHAALALRKAIKAVTPSLVASIMAETRERWIGWQFVATASSTGVAMGTDWTSGVVYGDDWGEAFGPVVRYRYPSGQPFNCVLPKLPDGTAEVIVCVMPDEVELLKSADCFGKYLEK